MFFLLALFLPFMRKVQVLEIKLISKRYLEDYTLDLNTEKNGKVTNEYLYTADYYSFDIGEVEAKSLRNHLLLYIIGMGAAFLIPLFMYSTLSRVVYVILPFVLLSIPIFLLGKAVSYLYRNNGLLKREEKDKSFDRIKGLPFLVFFLLLLEIIAQIVAYGKWSEELAVGDYALSIGTFLVLLFTFLFFQKTRSLKIKTEKNENANKIESK